MSSLQEFFHKQDFGLLLLRLLLGALLALHGVYFLMGGGFACHDLGGAATKVGLGFGRVAWGFLAALIYTVGGLFIMFGFIFRLVCFLVFLTMVVYAAPYWQANTLLKPITPHALTLLILSFCFLFIGPGNYSIDKK